MNQSAILFNDNWEFTKAPLGTSSSQMLADSSSGNWQPVSIPHDWMIANTTDLYEDGEGWYRKSFTLSDFDDTANRYLLYFDGVYMDNTIWINGQKAFVWPNGYSSFHFDATPYLHSGNNTIMVRSIYRCPNSRWYSGAGIYRNIYSLVLPITHLVTDSTYQSTRETNTNDHTWEIFCEAEVFNESNAALQRIVTFTLNYSDGTQIVNKAIPLTLSAGEVCKVSCIIPVKNPKLWDITDPVCYKLCTTLEDGEITDSITDTLGFRTISFSANDGFFLNHRHVKLNGACNHHDLGALGAAMNRTALRRQLVMLQQMGVNAVRTAHNMPAREWMELTDELGILVISEGFDMWERPKNPYDNARFFLEWYERDTRSWVTRDRNHPSLILWSIGNEIYDTHADATRGSEILCTLRDLVTSLDPNKNALVTFGSNYMPWKNTQICADEIPVIGYNYGEYLYAKHHEEHPDWVIYGSETASTAQSRGIYHFPYSQSLLSNDDMQCSSLGNCTTSWGAKNTMKCITDDRDASFSAGQFIWSGWDYLGEPTPYFTKNSYLGQIDTAGFPKDSYYQFQAEWTDFHTQPMIHLLPYWDFNEGQLIDVRVFTNAPSLELFVNGISQGVHAIDHQSGLSLSADYRIPYHAGELLAQAYDEEGTLLVTDCVHSFGDATTIVLNPDKETLLADGRDLIFLTISCNDRDGYPVANARNRMQITVTGAGRLVGLDNGDSTDYDSYQGTSRRLFSGKLLAMIAAKEGGGDIKVCVTSQGLSPTQLTLHALETILPEGIGSTFVESKWLPAYYELPRDGKRPTATLVPMDEICIRKIELTCEDLPCQDDSGYLLLDANHPCVTLLAQTFPVNATYHKIDWRIVNDAGIDSNLASLTVSEDGRQATITAKGDGIIRIRAQATNGREIAEVMSDLEFSITGLGKAGLNPYHFLSAGLSNASNVVLTNGNERGVATLRDGITYVGFRDLDFGDFGSDTLTLSVFYFSTDVLPIEIWEGMPDEPGAECITTLSWQADPQWNTYKECSFTLPRRIKGNTTLCFVLRQKIHMKGFVFATKRKAFELLYANENDHIAGDSFTIQPDGIYGIGNNVSLTFEQMDFGEDGIREITICGHSHIPCNTIHVRFHSYEDGLACNQIVEFGAKKPTPEDSDSIEDLGDGFVSRTFTLEPITGNQKVSFVFLPGSDFDMRTIQFR